MLTAYVPAILFNVKRFPKFSKCKKISELISSKKKIHIDHPLSHFYNDIIIVKISEHKLLGVVRNNQLTNQVISSLL